MNPELIEAFELHFNMKKSEIENLPVSEATRMHLYLGYQRSLKTFKAGVEFGKNHDSSTIPQNGSQL